MENGRDSSSSMPLLSRLDHMDFIMKYLERRKKLQKWGNNSSFRSNSEGQFRPLDLAVRETYFKESLMDRVTALENQLFQLCIEMESNSTSATSSQTSGYASSSQGSKTSLPTFNYKPNQTYKEETPIHDDKPEAYKEKTHIKEASLHSNPNNQKLGKNGLGDANVKTSKTIEKKVPPKWPRLKILGC